MQSSNRATQISNKSKGISMATASNTHGRSGSLATTQSASAPVIFLGRLLFVLMFLMAGFTHFSKPIIGFAASQGVPLASIIVPASGLLALLGGLSILFGYCARLGAWLIVI